MLVTGHAWKGPWQFFMTWGSSTKGTRQAERGSAMLVARATAGLGRCLSKTL